MKNLSDTAYSVVSLFQKAVNAQLKGDPATAASLYRQVPRQAPQYVPSLNNLGAIFLQQGNPDDAISCFQEAVGLQPKNVDAWNNLGVLWARIGDLKEAIRCYKKAHDLKPNDSEIHTNLGDAWRETGALDRAKNCHKRAIELAPHNAKAFNNLALVLKEEGRLADALVQFKEAIYRDPADEQIYFNLGATQVETGAFEEAVTVSHTALKRFPGSITTIVGAARVLLEAGRWETADGLIQKALGYPFTVAELPLLRHLLLYVNAASCSWEAVARLHFLSGRLMDKKWRDSNKTDRFQFSDRYDRLQKMRIGYVSPDFNRHSVGWFFREIIRHHDASRFDIYCYSLSQKMDDVTDAVRSAATKYETVEHMRDVEIAKRIYEDRIQILVDLAGYTRNNRLDIFAMRPAPVQITGIGYPHGTGLPSMDFRITDGFAEGPFAEDEYRETLLPLPDCFLPFPVFERKPPCVYRSQLGIPEKMVIFVSFNAWHKLRPEVLRLWNQILNKAPESGLVLSFRYAEKPYVQDRIRAYFDVAPNRIFFLPQQDTETHHRARYQIVDLALDPFPYNGTTTSWEALYMGVPVITLRGPRHVQRTTWSLLANLNLDMLAVDDTSSYVNTAVRLATTPDLLHRVKDRVEKSVQQRLQAGNSAYVLALEHRFQNAWNSRYTSFSSSRF